LTAFWPGSVSFFRLVSARRTTGSQPSLRKAACKKLKTFNALSEEKDEAGKRPCPGAASSAPKTLERTAADP